LPTYLQFKRHSARHRHLAANENRFKEDNWNVNNLPDKGCIPIGKKNKFIQHRPITKYDT